VTIIEGATVIGQARVRGRRAVVVKGGWVDEMKRLAVVRMTGVDLGNHGTHTRDAKESQNTPTCLHMGRAFRGSREVWRTVSV
jgi:hypothetical protein